MNTSMSYAVFLEPRGILKVLQFVFVICAFACTCDFRGTVVVTVYCSDNYTTTSTTTTVPVNVTSTETTAAETESESSDDQWNKIAASPLQAEWTALGRIPRQQEELISFDSANVEKEAAESVTFKIKFQYPFNLDKEYSTRTGCNGTDETMRLSGNYSSTASFYVFVGVFGMLFTLFAIVVYVFFQPTYEFMEWIPIADTAIHAIFTLMWFGSAIAWATALTQIKNHTKGSEVISYNKDICTEEDVCHAGYKIEYQLLDFSVIFGFLNVILFGGNVWFVFKETKFFKKPVSS